MTAGAAATVKWQVVRQILQCKTIGDVVVRGRWLTVTCDGMESEGDMRWGAKVSGRRSIGGRRWVIAYRTARIRRGAEPGSRTSTPGRLLGGLMTYRLGIDWRIVDEQPVHETGALEQRVPWPSTTLMDGGYWFAGIDGDRTVVVGGLQLRDVIADVTHHLTDVRTLCCRSRCLMPVTTAIDITMWQCSLWWRLQRL